MNQHNESVQRAAECVGSQAALARQLNVTPSAVNQWAMGARRVPAEHCLRIERLTDGAVRCEDLRPDVAWEVLRTTPDAASAATADQGVSHA